MNIWYLYNDICIIFLFSKGTLIKCDSILISISNKEFLLQKIFFLFIYFKISAQLFSALIIIINVS